MKKVLSAIFYVGKPEVGVLAGVTFLTIGNWLWFTLFFAQNYTEIVKMLYSPMGEDVISPKVMLYYVGVVILTLYSLFLILRFCSSFLGLKKIKFHYRLLLLFFLLCGGACIIYCCMGFCEYIATIQGLKIGEEKSFYFNGTQWVWLCVTGIVLLFVAYFTYAKMLAVASGVKLKEIFDLSVKVLWGLLVISYFANLGMALYASNQADIAVKRLETRFGKPLTAEGLAQTYYGNEKVDSAFWDKIRAEQGLLIAKLDKDNSLIFYLDYPDQSHAKPLKEWNRFWQENRDHVNSLDKLLSTEIPRPERSFENGVLFSLLLPELTLYRSICRILLMRLDVSIKNRDKVEVRQCLSSIAALNRVASKEVYLIGSLTWIAIEGMYIKYGVVNLLKAQILTDKELIQLKSELDSLEDLVPINHQQAIYCEAVFGLDFCNMLELGKGVKNIVFPLAPFRWVFPQFWRHMAMDKQELFTRYNVNDFSLIPKSSNPNFYFSDNLAPAGDSFFALTAKIRIAKTLIRAEEIRRKTGNFPDMLDDLPLDPFTQSPIKYRKGKFNYKTKYLRERSAGEAPDYRIDDKLKMDYKTIEVDGIQVWSVGRNRLDDNESNKNTSNPDDILGELFF